MTSVLLDLLALLLLVSGAAGLVVAAWSTDWRLGLTVLGAGAVVAGYAVGNRKDS